MTPFEQTEEQLFLKCLEMPPPEREAFLRSACFDDPQLKSAVLGLLRSHETAGGFMETPPEENSAKVAERLSRIAPSEESPGDQIGRYRLLELIGEGAWGSVWLAEQTRDIHRKVALKILKLGLDTKEFLARFEAERQMLAMMDHPHIAHVLDAGATDYGRPYLVMEWVKGMPLLEYATRKRLSLADRVRLFIKICAALQHAHQKGIIHRDLKPSNILVSVQDDEAVPKVIDFGVAKSNLRLTDKTLFTNRHTFIGTPVYSSPEQLEFNGSEVDPRSDVYSLGALLYEFLCGKTPFDYDKTRKEGMTAFRKRVREKVPPTPSQRFEKLPAEEKGALAKKHGCTPAKLQSHLKGDLDWIIMKCLEKEPSRRYPTAQALALDLQAYLDGAPVTAAAPGILYRTRKFISRKRPAHAIWAEMAAVVLGVLFLGSLFWPRAPGPPPVHFELTQFQEEITLAVLPLANHIPNADKAYFADAIHEEIFTQLGVINDLRVTGIASVRQYRDTQKTDRQIAEELQVRYLINGSVYLDENRTSITLRLADTVTGQQIWAETFNRSTDDLFTLRSAIAKDVAEQLHAVLSPEEVARLDGFPTENREAYDLYLLTKTSGLSHQDRQDALWRAVELDPNFYEAWSSILTGLLYRYRVITRRQEPELLEKARHVLEQLERTAPHQGYYLGRKSVFVYNVENDLQVSIRLLEQARKYNPNGPTRNLALRYLEMGRISEALPLYEEDYRRNPHSLATIQNLYLAYQLFEMWNKARSLIVKAREHSQYYSDFLAGFLPALNYIERGHLEAYITGLESEEHGDDSRISLAWPALISREYRKALDLFEEDEPDLMQLLTFSGRDWPSTFSLEPFDLGQALIWFQLDDKEQWRAHAEKARQALEAWIQDPYADPSSRYNLIVCYALLGERDKMDTLIDEVRKQIQSPNWAYRRGVLSEMHIAVAYIVLGEHDKAIEALEVAKEMEGSIFLSRELQLWFIFDRLKGNARFEALLRGEVLDPAEVVEEKIPLSTHPQAHALYLQALEVDRDSDERIKRIELLEQATALDPDFEKAWAEIANAMYGWPGNIDPHNERIGQKIEKALDELERFRPKIDVMVLRSNFRWRAQRDLDGALRMLHEAREWDPMHPGVNRHLGLRYQIQGDLTRAERYYELADQVTPLDNIIPINLVSVHAHQQKWAELEEIFTRIFQDERYQRGHSHHSKDHGTWLRRQAFFNFMRTGQLPAYLVALDAIPNDPEGLTYQDLSLIQRKLEPSLRILKADPDIRTMFESHRLFRLGVRSRELLLALLAFQLGWEGEKLNFAHQALGKQTKAFNQNAYAEPEEGALLALCYALIGEQEKAGDAIARSRAKLREPNHHYWASAYTEAIIAMVHIVLRDHQRAINTLEYAISLRHEFLNRHLDLWFIYDALREDPQTKERFEVLLRRELPAPEKQAVNLDSPSPLLPAINEKSIAVLPMKNMSPDPDNAFFADGVHEEILSHLSRIDDLLVISRTSTLQYRDTIKPIKQIANELGVRYVVEGSVRRDGDKVRVTSQLIDSITGGHVWADSYDQELDDIFLIQATIAKQIAVQLQAALSPEEIVEIDRPPTRNQEAYEYFQRSRKASDDRRVGLLEKAVGLDPDYVDAWASLATARLQEWRWVKNRNDPELLGEARHAISELERLDPDSSRVLEVKSGYAFRVEDDIETSIRYLLEARDKGSRTAARTLSSRYAQIGRMNESGLFVEEAFLADPLDRQLNVRLLEKYERNQLWSKADALLRHNLDLTRDDNSQWRGRISGSHAFWMWRAAKSNYRQTKDKTKWIEDTEAVPGFLENPEGKLWSALVKREMLPALEILQSGTLKEAFPVSLTNTWSKIDRQYFNVEPFSLIAALIRYELGEKERWLEQTQSAKSYLQQVIAGYPKVDPDFLSLLAVCFALEGNREQVESILPEIRELTRKTHWQYRRQAVCELKIAAAYLILSDHDKAMGILEMAAKMDSRMIIALELDLWFIFDRLRGNPRFEALLRGELAALPESN